MQLLVTCLLITLGVVGCAVVSAGGSSASTPETEERSAGGIVWFRTTKLEEITRFYLQVMDCSIWLEQDQCTILQHGNLLLGFCQSDKTDLDALPCFFYRDKHRVNQMYQKLKETAEHAPRENDRYRIYHFYAYDPEGRRLECQHFNHALLPF